MGQLPEPISKQDKLLHNIADGTPNIDNIEPVSREDYYLKEIAINGVPLKDIPLTVDKGGTGATTDSGARTNLSVYSKSETDTLLSAKANTSDLSTVATSGSYTDLLNKPTIPTNVSDLTNDSGYITNSVNNLMYYYTKTETDSAIATANQKTGTWTPILVNYTDDMHPNVVVDPTYTVDYSNAHYLKMGKLVHISFRIKVIVTDIGTGYACVAGLPFNPDQSMLGQSFCIAENSAVTETQGVVYDGVVGQLYPDIYLETYNERHMPAISLRTDNGIQAKTFKVGTNWISYSGCYVCDDAYVPSPEALITVEHGGTGATTVSSARTNLDVYSKSETDSAISTAINNITNADGVSY